MPDNKTQNDRSVSMDAYNEALDWLKAEQLKKRYKDSYKASERPKQSEPSAIPKTVVKDKKQKSAERHFPSLLNKKTFAAAAVIAVVAGLIFAIRHLPDDIGITVDKTSQTEENADNQMPQEYATVWLENKAINEDYVGQVVFDSGLIDLSFVQAKSVYKENGEMYKFYTEDGDLVKNPNGYTGNDVYIWTNWKTGKYDKTDEGGSVFMDYRNELDDQNILIYGHHFARDWDPSGSKQFTPLDKLLEKKNYLLNNKLKLILDHEIRYYTVARVFTIDTSDEEQSQIARTNMNKTMKNEDDPGYFAKYIKLMDQMANYNTKVRLNENDNILTLVTCIQHQPQYRQIIVCKEDKVEHYD